MKAMVLSGPEVLAPGRVPPPQLDPGEVLVRVTHSGVCGTDYKIFTGAIPAKYPLVMGHEIAGEVADHAGSAALRRGERVVVDPELYCGACFHCRIGQTHLCPNGVLIGRDRDGGFAEYVAAPASHVFPLPPSIELRAAPLVQVLTTCLHAQRQVAIFPGESVVVLGLGVTGQLHVQLAKARGASPIVGVTRSPARRALAERLGADLTVPSDHGAADRVREATDGRGADVVIETTGVVGSLAAAIEMARPGARVLLFGIITARDGSLPFYDIYFKELRLIGARVAKSEDYPTALALVDRGQIALDPLISDVMPLDALGSAIGLLGTDAGTRMKIILDHAG